MTAFVSHDIIAKVGVTCIDHIVDGMAEAHSFVAMLPDSLLLPNFEESLGARLPHTWLHSLSKEACTLVLRLAEFITYYYRV